MKRVSWWDSDRSRANEWLSIYIYIYLRFSVKVRTAYWELVAPASGSWWNVASYVYDNWNQLWVCVIDMNSDVWQVKFAWEYLKQIVSTNYSVDSKNYITYNNSILSAFLRTYLILSIWKSRYIIFNNILTWSLEYGDETKFTWILCTICLYAKV